MSEVGVIVDTGSGGRVREGCACSVRYVGVHPAIHSGGYVSQDGWGNVISAADSRGGRSMSTAVAEGAVQRNGSRSQATSSDASSVSEPPAGQRAVVIVGLLQFAPGAALRGREFNTVGQSLKAAALPGKAQTTVDLWLNSPGGSARSAYKIALLLRSIACRVRPVPGSRVEEKEASYRSIMPYLVITTRRPGRGISPQRRRSPLQWAHAIWRCRTRIPPRCRAQ
jgi:hypothetical protein